MDIMTILEDMSGAVVFTNDPEHFILWYKGGTYIHIGVYTEDTIEEVNVRGGHEGMENWTLLQIQDKLAEVWDEIEDEAEVWDEIEDEENEYEDD